MFNFSLGLFAIGVVFFFGAILLERVTKRRRISNLARLEWDMFVVGIAFSALGFALTVVSLLLDAEWKTLVAVAVVCVIGVEITILFLGEPDNSPQVAKR